MTYPCEDVSCPALMNPSATVVTSVKCNVCYRTCNSTKTSSGSSLFKLSAATEADMRLLTHREKLTLSRRRLAEAQTKEEREKILRLLAKEEAKDGIVAYLLGTSKNLA